MQSQHRTPSTAPGPYRARVTSYVLIVLVGLVYLLFAPLLVPFWWLPMLWLVWVAGFLLMRRVGKRSSWLMLGAAPSLYLLFGAFVVILSEAGYRAPY